MEPKRERELASMHARAGRQADLVPVPALGYAPRHKRVAGAGPTLRTDETRRPAYVAEVLCALLFRSEELLKLDERPRPRLLGERIQGLNIVGQRGRVVVRDFAASHRGLQYANGPGTRQRYWWCLPESTG